MPTTSHRSQTSPMPDNQHDIARNPIVSVIMPAYNVERYVSDAVRSALGQTLRNIEVIVVDDGSTDGTGATLSGLAEGDDRLRVISAENGGAPRARNIALGMASGKYVYFADADDYIMPAALETMVAIAEKSSLELVVAGFEIDTYMRPNLVPSLLKANVGEDEFGIYARERKSSGYAIYESAEPFRRKAHLLFDKNLLYTPWNKLFLRSRIEENHFRFREGDFWDDFPFCLDYIRDVERVGVIPDVVYRFRRIRQDSETSRWRDCYEKREEEHGWMVDLYRHWNLITDQEVDEMLHRRYIERVVGCVESVCDPAANLGRAERLERIERMMTTGRVENALKSARPKSKMMSIMLVPMHMRSARLMELEGRVISFAKRRTPELFAALKARR